MRGLDEREQVEVRPIGGIETAAHVLAVDLGTGGPKVAVMASTGKVVSHAFEPVSLMLTEDGGAEQDPEAWWTAITKAGRRAVEESEVDPFQIIGVGCTAQWLGTVPIDPEGKAIGNSMIWMDSRGSSLVRKRVGGPAFGYKMTYIPRWLRLTGGVPSLSGKDPVGHILWLEEHRPDVVAGTSVYLEPIDYLNFRLTGLPRASGDSITMHWVTDNRRPMEVAYDPTLLRRAGLNPKQLPPILTTGSVLGGVTAEAAEALGILAGTPVVTGTGDLHSAAVGSGAVEDFDGHLYMGTSSWISCHVPWKKVSPSTNITSIPAGVPGRFIVADEHETGGACLTWLRDAVVYPTGNAPQDAFVRFNEIASSVPPGSHGTIFTPWLNGERTPVDDHTIRGGFHNLGLATTQADMVRAVFEGVALNSRWLLGSVEKYLKRPLESLAFIGGGANSDFWSQMHADVLGREIRQVADPVLANVRGAGLLTLLALNRCKLEDVKDMVSIKSTYQPDPTASKAYDEPFEAFKSLYSTTKKIHRRLNHRL